MSSARCWRGINPAANVAWMELLQALEHEALEALFVVLFFCFYSIARRFEKSSTLVTEKLRRTCGHGVLWAREGLEVRT